MEPGRIIGLIFALASTFILAYLFKSGKFNRRIGYVFIAISILMGFIFFSPMLPIQLQAFILGDSPQGVPIAMALFGIIIFIVLALVLGRFFCGYLCPIGAVQELAYSIPVKKLKIENKKAMMAFRLFFLLSIIVAGVVFTANVLGYIGVGNFFLLSVSTIPFWLFAGIVVLSIFVYRPFCRLACPYGTLLSLSSAKGIFKLRRNDKCIKCKKCEKACPTSEAGAEDMKMECYMCYRCLEVCPVDAIEYGKQ
ncbi:MAG: 4Fe-4S binding protein [Thermoplasmata archaeon]|nr:4Fe-4S binding protein [Thermoplasmata archaeon]